MHLAQNGPSEEYGICKVGTSAAFLTTYLAIDAFKPELVISAGTAGGFESNGAEIGSIFVSTTTVNHDRRIPLPGFKEFGLDKKATHPMNAIAASLGMQHPSFIPASCIAINVGFFVMCSRLVAYASLWLFPGVTPGACFKRRTTLPVGDGYKPQSTAVATIPNNTNHAHVYKAFSDHSGSILPQHAPSVHRFRVDTSCA